jgi:hypothetical protein
MEYFYKIAAVDPETGNILALLTGEYETIGEAQKELNNMTRAGGWFEIKLYFRN